MRVGVDLDEVIYPFVQTWRAYANVPVRPAECWEFYTLDGYNLPEYMQVFRDGVDRGVIFADGDPRPGAIQFLSQLHALGHSIHFVTDRFVGTHSQINTAYWLRDKKVPFDTLTFSKDKTLVNTDTFIDDKPANVDALRSAGIPAFLLDTGRTDQVGHQWAVEGFQEFLSEVAALETT